MASIVPSIALQDFKEGGGHETEQSENENNENNERRRSSIFATPPARRLLLSSSLPVDSLPADQQMSVSACSDRNWDEKMKKRTNLMASLAVVSICVNIFMLEYFWDGEEYNSGFTGNIIKCFQSIVTFFLVILVTDYYRQQIKRLFDEFEVGGGKRCPFFSGSSPFWLSYLLELAVILLHPIPFLSKTGSFNEHNPDIRLWSHQFMSFISSDALAVLGLLRLYLFVRVVRDHSDIFQWRESVQSSGQLNPREPIAFNSFLTIKTYFYIKPWTFLFYACGSCVLLFSYSIYVVEREIQPEVFGTIGNVFYFTCVTMSTVGYGEIFPRSTWARLIAMSSALSGICLSGLLVTALLKSFTLSPNQKIAADFVHQRRYLSKKRQFEAKLIQQKCKEERDELEGVDEDGDDVEVEVEEVKRKWLCNNFWCAPNSKKKIKEKDVTAFPFEASFGLGMTSHHSSFKGEDSELQMILRGLNDLDRKINQIQQRLQLNIKS